MYKLHQEIEHFMEPLVYQYVIDSYFERTMDEYKSRRFSKKNCIA